MPLMNLFCLSIGNGAFEPCRHNPSTDTIKGSLVGLAECLHWCITVNGVDHNLGRSYAADSVKPWGDELLGSVVDIVTFHIAFHENCLDDDVAVELSH